MSNVGTYQFPKKLILLMISSTWEARRSLVSGKGDQNRYWFHIKELTGSLYEVVTKSNHCEAYKIGG